MSQSQVEEPKINSEILVDESSELSELRSEILSLKKQIGNLKQDIKELKEGLALVFTPVDGINKAISSIASFGLDLAKPKKNRERH